MKTKLILFVSVIFYFSFWGAIAAYGPYRNAFNAGECSPLVKYRIDLQQYGSACQTLENIVVVPQGAAVRRPGTEYIHDANDIMNTRLTEFERSTDTAYTLEWGHHQLHFYTDGGRIQQ